MNNVNTRLFNSYSHVHSIYFCYLMNAVPHQPLRLAVKKNMVLNDIYTGGTLINNFVFFVVS